jgi:PAS domain S-box-containing protein
MPEQLNVLILEDHPADAELMVHELRRAGFEPAWRRVDTEAGFAAALDPGLDVILADHNLPGYDSHRALRLVQERGLDVPVLVVSGSLGEEAATEAMRLGAADYLLKDRLNRLGPAVANALETKELRAGKRRAEEAVRLAAEQWRKTFDAIGDSVCLLDLEGRVLRCNRSMAELVGKSIPEALGRTCCELVHGTRKPLPGCPFLRMKETRRRETKVISLGDRWFSVVADPVFDEAGELVGGVHVISDITGRKQAEEAVRRSETQLRDILDNSTTVVFVKDLQGRYLLVNRRYEELFHVGREAVVGKTDHDIFPEQFAKAFQEADRRALESGGPIEAEEEVPQDDGVHSYISIKFPLSGPDGKPYAVCGVATDITERKHAEQRLRHVLAGARCLLWHADVQERAGEFLWDTRVVNPDSAQAFLGIEMPPDQSFDDVFYAFKLPEYRDPMDAVSTAAIRAGAAGYAQEFRCRWADGPIRWMYEDVHIRAVGPGRWELTGVCTDITERKQAEEALRESNSRLETALVELTETQQQVVQQERLRALGTMASGIAHDFNNTLMPVLGYTDLLLAEPERLADTNRSVGFLEIVNTAAHDATKVVERLREFYRHREDVEMLGVVRLDQLVEEAVALTQPKWKDQAQANGVDVRIELDLEEVPPFSGNEANLREALTNLILNAVDAMPEGGVITIGCQVPSAKCQVSGDGSQVSSVKCQVPGDDSAPDDMARDTWHVTPEHVTLIVSDTGTGMPEEIRRRCLEPFFSTKGEHGTGLGLAMVYGIVQRHDGEIEIDSAPGEGTTFRLQFPVQTPGAAAPERAPSAAVLRSLRVLVVDDEPSVRELLSEYLRVDGHAVTTATNGRKGLEAFRDGTFDLVLTDRAMPEMNGDRLALAIKQLAPDMPVLMLSGFGDMMKSADELPAGVDAVVGKPVTLATLRDGMAALTAKSG